jgi:hypothetical protein
MITESGPAERLLALMPSGPRSWAFLHGEDLLARGDLVSDLDVVTRTDPRQLIPRLADCARTLADLHLCMIVRYDVASWACIWMSTDAAQVVTLDMTSDSRGRNKYGMRTDVLLARSAMGIAFPTINSEDELIYRLVKRLYKGDEEARVIAEQVRGSSRLMKRLKIAFSRRTDRAVRKYLGTGGYRRPRRLHETMRIAERIFHPTGLVVGVVGSDQVHGGEMAEVLASEFHGLIPRVRTCPAAQAKMSTVFLSRRRPELLVIHGTAREIAMLGIERIDPDLDSVGAATAVVAALSSQASRNFRRWTK